MNRRKIKLEQLELFDEFPIKYIKRKKLEEEVDERWREWLESEGADEDEL